MAPTLLASILNCSISSGVDMVVIFKPPIQEIAKYYVPVSPVKFCATDSGTRDARPASLCHKLHALGERHHIGLKLFPGKAFP